MNLSRLHLYLHDVALLESTDPGCNNAALQDCRTLELKSADAVMQSHVLLGHRVNAQRDTQRLGNGLRFIQLWRDTSLLGSSWIVNGGGRYVDEVNWLLPITEREFWVRDVYISPHCRGQKLFPTFLRLIAQNHVPGCQRMWSDVDWPHTASLRAHYAVGFKLHARVRAFDVAGRWRWRSRLVPWDLTVQQIAPQNRFIWLRGAQRQRHLELMA